MMRKFNVLIIEDNEEIVSVIELYKPDEINFIKAFDGQEGINLFESELIDVVVLDLMLPKISGYEVLKHIRNKSDVPILILSSKKLDEEVVLGLKKGADDYLTKPFSVAELMARINVLIRRFCVKEQDSHQIKIGNILLDKKSCELYKDGQLIELTAKEYKMMELFMMNPNHVLTRNQILDHLWRDEYYDDNIVVVYISRLREKIEEDPKRPKHITTLRGLGYKFNES